jgi:hypothetical protein
MNISLTVTPEDFRSNAIEAYKTAIHELLEQIKHYDTVPLHIQAQVTDPKGNHVHIEGVY